MQSQSDLLVYRDNNLKEFFLTKYINACNDTVNIMGFLLKLCQKHECALLHV